YSDVDAIRSEPSEGDPVDIHLPAMEIPRDADLGLRDSCCLKVEARVEVDFPLFGERQVSTHIQGLRDIFIVVDRSGVGKVVAHGQIPGNVPINVLTWIGHDAVDLVLGKFIHDASPLNKILRDLIPDFPWSLPLARIDRSVHVKRSVSDHTNSLSV